MNKRIPVFKISDLRAGQIIEVDNNIYTIESFDKRIDSIFINVVETSEQFLFDQTRVKFNFREI